MNTGESNCPDCGHELCCCPDDDYLRQYPDYEKALWHDWVKSVCKRRRMVPPDGVEWVTLMQRWCHGKAPADSVDELALMRRAG